MSTSFFTRCAIRSAVWYHRLLAASHGSGVSSHATLNRFNRSLTTLSGHSTLTVNGNSDVATRNSVRRDLLCKSIHPLSVQVRGAKKKKSSGPRKDDSDDESGDEEEEKDELSNLGGYEDHTVVVPSLRLDNLLKAGTKFARSNIDTAFFESRVRMNEERTTKKAELATVHDVLDYIHGRDPENPDMLTIDRVEVLSVPDIGLNSGKMKVKVRRFRNLQISNYPKDPYDGPAVYVRPDSREEK